MDLLLEAQGMRALGLALDLALKAHRLLLVEACLRLSQFPEEQGVEPVELGRRQQKAVEENQILDLLQREVRNQGRKDLAHNPCDLLVALGAFRHRSLRQRVALGIEGQCLGYSWGFDPYPWVFLVDSAFLSSLA